MKGTELLEKSKELVDEIYGAMAMIEKCEVIAEEVKDKDFVFYKKNEDKTESAIYLDDVMTFNQKHNIRCIIVSSILKNKQDAEEKLNALLQRKPEPKKEEDPEVLSLESGDEEEEKQGLTIEGVRELIKENSKITQKEIAEKFGVKQSSVSAFLKRHPEVRPS